MWQKKAWDIVPDMEAARQRAENVRVDVLEAAVDQAMFETFPILRRMEAAERLGAKTEEVAK